ncbi:MAG: hypothetical protein N2652_05235 [Kiritimatiellae bacterium]|nr:hypothetical protein [Kiritimatiellia bacterium]
MSRWLRRWAPLAVGAVALAAMVAAAWSAFGAEARARVGRRRTVVGGGSGGAEEAPTTSPLPAAGLTVLRVEFGSRGAAGRKEPTVWDGSLEVSPGRVVAIRSWWRDPRDLVTGATWKVTTRRSIPWNREQRQRGHETMPLQDSALLIELADTTAETELRFRTAQGDFQVRLNELDGGRAVWRMDGLVAVSRAAAATTILSAPTEDDWPAVAVGPDGGLYVAYVAFRHGEKFRVRNEPTEMPDSFADLAEPTGGDQVLLMRWKNGRWDGPWEVTPAGGDVFRPAAAVDGQGSVWVFWTAKQDGRWDLFARRRAADEWSPAQALTKSAGPDLLPAAARDREGRVWVTWMAFREDGHADILAARQEGERIGSPQVVSDRPGNQWGPAIAASEDGQVAIAWDSYEHGNYDVFLRRWAAGRWEEIVPVAASAAGEMRPSMVFDRDGRLWVAYEKSPELWGKDFGAAVRDKGVGLLMERSVEVRVWDRGSWAEPVQPAAEAFAPPALASRRPAAGSRGARRRGTLALPVLAYDPAGRVWLAVRTARAGGRVGVGTVWLTHLAWYEGDRWSDEIICDRSDHLLDSRPAFAALSDGALAMVCASDGRIETAARLPDWFVRELRREGQMVAEPVLKARWPDPVNSELVAARLSSPFRPAAPPQLRPLATAPAVAGKDERARKEERDVAALRAARVTVGGRTYRLARGEFHRHTEISSDGGGDGMLMDMWRYGLDAAALEWIGNGDHDNGGGREYPWWIIQKTTDLFRVPGAFAPVYSYERSVSYPDGHRNVVFAQRGVRTLHRLRGGLGKAMDDLPEDADRPSSPDTQMLYRYLAEHDGICASHTSGTDMGTDWRDNNPKVEPVVEIYQGCRQNYEMPGAPRANTAEHSIGGWRPLGFVSRALKKGYRLGFQASSDHTSTHISYCNVWVEDLTPEGIVAGMKARRVYGATDNILADVRCGEHFMGEEFSIRGRPTLQVRLRGTAPFARVHIIRDGAYVHTEEPNSADVYFQWTDMSAEPGPARYYYVRGEQADGELVWVSPMWITVTP